MADEKSPTAMVIGETVVRAAVAILVPFGGAAVVVYDAIRGHMATQGQLTIEEITEQVGAERLAERITDSPEFAALAVNALDTALRTGFEAQRPDLQRARRRARQHHELRTTTARRTQRVANPSSPVRSAGQMSQ